MPTRKEQIQGTSELDKIELALVTLLHTDEAASHQMQLLRHQSFAPEIDKRQVDITPLLPFEPNLESPWLFGWRPPEQDARVPSSPKMLLNPVEDLLGNEFCFATLYDETIQHKDLLHFHWFKKLKKMPKHFFSPTAHTHIFAGYNGAVCVDGSAEFQKHIHGWKRGKYIPITLNGGQRHMNYRDEVWQQERMRLVASAGFAEHTHYGWRIKVSSDAGSVRLVSDGIGIRNLASLRDDPLAGKSQRLSPLLHWVKSHSRRKHSNLDYTQVKKHLRGITEFDLGSVYVEIEDPQKPGTECEECQQPEYPIIEGICVTCWESICGPEVWRA